MPNLAAFESLHIISVPGLHFDKDIPIWWPSSSEPTKSPITEKFSNLCKKFPFVKSELVSFIHRKESPMIAWSLRASKTWTPLKNASLPVLVGTGPTPYLLCSRNLRVV